MMQERVDFYELDINSGKSFPLLEHSEFNKKKILLESSFPEVNPFDFYRDIFPIGSFERLGHQEDKKGNGVALVIDIKKTAKHRGTKTILTDGLEQLESLLKQDFVVLSPISYFGRSRRAKNALWLHALTLDIDYVQEKHLRNFLHWLKHPEYRYAPHPTYIVNSGHGIHLYYVFEEPVPMYENIQAELKKLKTALIKRTWTKYTSEHPERLEALGIVQGFRMVGSPTKLPGFKLTAYKSGEKVTLEYLNGFADEKNQAMLGKTKSKYTLEQAKKLFPDWYQSRVVENLDFTKWNIKRDLYDWFHRQLLIDGKATVGHRYFCIMCLAVYASKCNVSYNELEKDALELQPLFDELSDTERFTVEETYKALDVYNHDFDRFPRATIERISAVSMPVNKRNGRKQEQHLKIARFARDISNDNWRKGNGRPKGSKDKKPRAAYPVPKKTLIQNYKKENPGLSNRQIAINLQVSRNTVNKWLK